jgi:tRNA A-37 threonylcarbamoyl transferase component Bud32
MAGFTNRRGPLTDSNPVRKILKDLSNLGMAYDDMIIRNSRAVGFTENAMGYTMNPMGSDADDMYAAFAALSLTDTSLKKNISFFDKDYEKKREQLRTFAVQDEIEDILDVICICRV